MHLRANFPFQLAIFGVLVFLIATASIIGSVRLFTNFTENRQTTAHQPPDTTSGTSENHDTLKSTHMEVEREAYYRTLACYWSTNSDQASSSCTDAEHHELNKLRPIPLQLRS